MKNVFEILQGIFGFIKYWKKLIEDSTREYHGRYENLCYYYHAMKDVLVFPCEPFASLWEEFHPITQFLSALEDQFVENGSVCKEYNEDDFIG
jgi:hypothetical protein